jgi:predicted amidohydrolase
VKIALAQINPTVGDFTGNLEKLLPQAIAPPHSARA